VVLLVLIVIMCVALWNLFGNAVGAKLQSAAAEFDEEVQTEDTSGVQDDTVTTENNYEDGR
jgi:hypothetical protein